MWLVNVMYALSRHNEHVTTWAEITNCAQNDYNIILQYQDHVLKFCVLIQSCRHLKTLQLSALKEQIAMAGSKRKLPNLYCSHSNGHPEIETWKACVFGSISYLIVVSVQTVNMCFYVPDDLQLLLNLLFGTFCSLQIKNMKDIFCCYAFSSDHLNY